MNHSIQQTLAQKMDSIRELLEATSFSDVKFYAPWLAQTHFLVQHSTRMLAFSAGLLPLDLQPIHQRFLKHAAEEMGHEVMAKSDLENLGFALEEYPILDPTKRLKELQFQSIYQTHPLSFLGYVLFLETLAVSIGKQEYPKLKQRFQDSCCVFVRVHSDEDEEHVRQLERLIEALPLQLQSLIQKNLSESAEIYISMLQQLAANASMKSSEAA